MTIAVPLWVALTSPILIAALAFNIAAVRAEIRKVKAG